MGKIAKRRQLRKSTHAQIGFQEYWFFLVFGFQICAEISGMEKKFILSAVGFQS